MYKSIKKTIEEIKFYLPIILILPPILGGLWQLVELFRIDPSYIRFFSATQLLPDGLLMLLILISTAPLLLIMIVLHTVIPEDISAKEEKIKITTQSDLKHFYILKSKQSKLKYRSECNNKLTIGPMLTLVFITFLLFGSIYIDISKDEVTLFSFLLKIFFAFLFLSFTLFACTTIWKCSKSQLINKITKSKIFFVVSAMIYGAIVIIFDFIIIIIVPLFIALSIHQVYLFPYNLINAKKIDNKINKKYKSSKLLYINDKYIFIEHMDKNESKSVQIMKFDTLFQEAKK